MNIDCVKVEYRKYLNEHDGEVPTQVTMCWNTYRDLVHNIRNDQILGVDILISPYILPDFIYFEGRQ